MPGRPKGGLHVSGPVRPPFTLKSVALCVSLALAAPYAQAQTAPKRLSDWLVEQRQDANAYPLGLSWRVPEEIEPQSRLRAELVRSLSGRGGDVKAPPSAVARLRNWLQTLPITGRVPIALADVHWLQANPQRDPVLLPGHSVILPPRPASVTVVRSDGSLCPVQHTPNREARAYVDQCGEDGADWAWVAQPDGRVQRFGIANWNREKQDELAPGAWIWAPGRNSGWPEAFSEKLISFLATQGPAPDVIGVAPKDSTSARNSVSRGAAAAAYMARPAAELPVVEAAQVPPSYSRSRSAEYTASDWGNVGLLQTPTARMFDTGHFWFHIDRTYPYTQGNVFLQPFSWMEAGFRYTSVSNRLYGPAELSGTQAYKDKSIDVKLHLWEESAHVPQIALGLRDVAGTGLFSGEYLVASKRTNMLDWSLGIGWGYVGGRGNLRNPLSSISSRFDTRKTDVGQGGNFAFGSYFRGATSLFGGVQYQTPWEKLIVKLEYDGNNYQHEPQANNLPQHSPFNFGLVYRAGKSADISLGIERGNKVMLGLTLHSQLDGLSAPKSQDPPRVPVAPNRPAQFPDWERTARDIGAQTQWHVSEIMQRGRELRLTVDDPSAVYWRERVDRAAAVLHRDSPANVDRFTLAYRQRGEEVAEHIVDRDTWVKQQTQPVPPSEQRDAVIARAPAPAAPYEPTGSVVYENRQPRFEHGLGLNYIQTLGGPDGFVLYQVSAVERAKYRFRDDTWLQGAVRARLVDNYDKFKYTAPSNLPRVRTFLREYLTTSTITMPYLQLTHVGKLTDSQYYSVYGGYLEEMFGGVGAEWLYRPFRSPVAYGIDVNEVRQRDFHQDFGFRDYRTTTGHATLYWDTGWNDVLVTASAGRYLAGDMGGTLQVSRVFKNGVSIGAFATRTNVSKEQFGEGSFDKGIFVSIPFDAFLTKSSDTIGTFLWKPLTRDGGAKLARQVQLYDVTRQRDDRVLRLEAAPPPSDQVLPADRKERWTPSVSLQTPHVPISPKPLTVEWGKPELENRELIQALYGLGYRDVSVQYDVSHRLTLKIANDHVEPVSRAVAVAARAASRLAPLDTREIRIVFVGRTMPLVTYHFLDVRKLDRYLGGAISDREFADSVVIEYQPYATREANPLAGFKNLDTPLPSTAITNPLPETFSVGRVINDYKAAAHTFSDVNWTQAAIYGGGAILGASTLDRRAFTFAQNHKEARWLKAGVSFGDALPWLGLAGSAATALLSTDPQLSRTSYAATEAGAAALLVSTGLKYAVGRARPEAGLGTRSFEHFSSDNRYNAFPSRHTAVAWAVATPYALEYDAKWLYGVAALTNLARIGSREHWVSDTVAGSVIGYGLGRIFWQSGKDQGKNQPRVILHPNGVGVSWQLP
ncbi:MAG: YjbH domain-containing protein [Rhodospirillaceae bacterium]